MERRGCQRGCSGGGVACGALRWRITRVLVARRAQARPGLRVPGHARRAGRAPHARAPPRPGRPARRTTGWRARAPRPAWRPRGRRRARPPAARPSRPACPARRTRAPLTSAARSCESGARAACARAQRGARRRGLPRARAQAVARERRGGLVPGRRRCLLGRALPVREVQEERRGERLARAGRQSRRQALHARHPAPASSRRQHANAYRREKWGGPTAASKSSNAPSTLSDRRAASPGLGPGASEPAQPARVTPLRPRTSAAWSASSSMKSSSAAAAAGPSSRSTAATAPASTASARRGCPASSTPRSVRTCAAAPPPC
jgi:hypothetical protein